MNIEVPFISMRCAAAVVVVNPGFVPVSGTDWKGKRI